MTFPETEAPLTVSIAPGGNPADQDTWTWEDITTYVRTEDGVSISGGRQDEGGRVDPTTCNLTLDNTDGRFSPRNAEGPWYGQLGRNTPLRVRWGLDSDSFGTNVSGSWGTTAGGRTWTNFGSGGTVDAADFEVTGGEGVHKVEAANAYRGTWLDCNLLDVDVTTTVRLDLASITGAAVEPAGVMLRVQDSNNYYLAGLRLNTSGTVSTVIKVVLDGVDSTLDTQTSLDTTYPASQPLKLRARIVGTKIQAKVWSAAADEPAWDPLSQASALVDADMILGWPGTPGGVGIRSNVLTSNSNTKPISFYYDNFSVAVDRFVGFVTEWPQRWDKTATNVYVPIEASGILRRLAQGTKALESPLRRRIPPLAPAAYWPLEDKDGTTLAGSPIAGVGPMKVGGFSFESESSLAGSDALPTMDVATSYTGTVPSYSGTEWHVEFVCKMDEAPNSNRLILVHTSGTVRRWDVTVQTSSISVQGYDDEAAEVLNEGFVPTDFFGNWCRLALTAHQSGGNIEYVLRTTNIATGASQEITRTEAGTSGAVRRVSLPQRGSGASVAAIGHIAVFPTYDFPTAFNGADSGWLNETAQARVARLCAENDIPLIKFTQDEFSEDMGAQPLASLLDILRDSEATDGGTLFEIDGGLGYMARDRRYNQDVTLALDMTAGEVAEPPEPTDDDQQLRNDTIVARSDGGSARYVDAESVAAVGTYDQELTLNAYSDEQLLDLAGWATHLGTTDEMRWPRIDIDLARNTHLIDTWLGMRIGARCTVTQGLAQIPGVEIDVLVDGWTEYFGPYEWRAALNAVPASPWKVGVLDDATQGVLDTEGSELASSVASSDTSLAVTTTEGPLWTTDAADMPFDVKVGGEVMTVTDVDSAMTDTFTRSTSNGWGTADSGQAWTTSGGAASDYATNGSLGYVTHSVVNTRKCVTAGSFSDVELLSQIKVSATPSGANVIGGLVSRYADDNNSYHCWLVFSTTDTITLTIAKRVAGAFTTLQTVTLPGTFAAGTFMWIRWSVVGSTLKARTWQDGTNEPSGWMLETTDSAFTSGAIGTHSVLLTGNTSFPTFSWDNFANLIPQTFTVTRSVNGVAKSHDAGSDVRLAQPLVLSTVSMHN